LETIGGDFEPRSLRSWVKSMLNLNMKQVQNPNKTLKSVEESFLGYM
jgi:hypothetical protein